MPMSQVLWVLLWVLNADTFTGRCVKVVDGDTLEVTRQRLVLRVRVADIDSPELCQPLFEAATSFASDLVKGREVVVQGRSWDENGRLVARVLLGDRDLSMELVKAGFAWQYKGYSSDRRLAALESEARAARRGLWALPSPEPPWEYRRRMRQAAASGRSISCGPYHGNVRSRVFHWRLCPQFECKNCTRSFQKRNEALSAGFYPCGSCRP